MRAPEHHFRCGFIPLTDCAPLVVAHEMGFAAEEGVTLDLQREASWSNIRDKIAFEAVDAAHMLAPMPVAMSLGLSATPARIEAPMGLSANGDVVVVSNELAQAMRAARGRDSVFAADAAAAAADLRRATRRRLRIGVPWSFSMHALLTEYWLGRSGFDLNRDIEMSVVPPPFMAEALSAGEVDLFCVGEPWGSMAVEAGAGAILLSTTAIWRFSPEKVLGLRAATIQEREPAVLALVRALARAAHWCGNPSHHGALSEILAHRAYVDAPADAIERALTGTFVVDERGEVRHVPRAIAFGEGAACFPWRSHATWIAAALAQRCDLDSEAIATAATVFRPDLFRKALAPIGAEMPGASEKLEGALSSETEVAGVAGPLLLGPDAFFDGAVFDPHLPEALKF